MKNKHASAMAKLRAASMSPERRKEIASKAGSSWWANLTETEKAERIAKLTEARKLNKKRRNQTSG
jgi:enterochelin esterase-like enzyme